MLDFDIMQRYKLLRQSFLVILIAQTGHMLELLFEVLMIEVEQVGDTSLNVMIYTHLRHLALKVSAS
jgi:hypothetical protein